MSALAGRTALVSGASRGIGLDVARALAADGMRVIDGRAVGGRVARAPRRSVGRAIPMPCDVADGGAVGSSRRATSRDVGGAPDVIVNNAGDFKLSRPSRPPSPEEFRAALDVNLVAPFLLARAFLADMPRAEARTHRDDRLDCRPRHVCRKRRVRREQVRAPRASSRCSAPSCAAAACAPRSCRRVAVDTDALGRGRYRTRGPGSHRAAACCPSARRRRSGSLSSVSLPAEVNVDELRLSRS